MTDNHRPQPPDPGEAPCQVDATSPSPGACDWSDGANWADPRTRTTGTAPDACGYASFQDEVPDQAVIIDTSGGAG